MSSTPDDPKPSEGEPAGAELAVNQPADGSEAPISDLPGSIGRNVHQSIDTGKRMRQDRLFKRACVVIAATCVLILAFLLVSIVSQGLPALSTTLVTGSPEPEPSEAGMWPAITGTISALVLDSAARTASSTRRWSSSL